jgi:hypothetical protein
LIIWEFRGFDPAGTRVGILKSWNDGKDNMEYWNTGKLE